MKKISSFFVAMLCSVLIFAQEKVTIGTEDGKLTVTKSNLWYQSPWVWVAGAAIIILLLVVLMRGGRRKD